MQGTSEVQKAEPSLQSIPLELIDFSPYQIRSRIDEAGLRELATSMDQTGLAQPILLRPMGARYQIVVGERRTRAANLLGWKSIPAVVKELSDVEAALLVLIEDQQRKDANLVERARGYQRLKEKFALGQEEIANRLGVSQPTVSRLLSLLDEPAEIQELVAQDKIGAKHLPALDTIEDPEQRIALASEAARNGWSARETERRVHKALKSRARKAEDGSAKQKGSSLVKQAHASLLGEWFEEVFHFFHSMTELRRALKAVLHFLARLIPNGQDRSPRWIRERYDRPHEPAAREASHPDSKPPKPA